jgi:[acyl-carrier-protein] S-malonyltransferase
MRAASEQFAYAVELAGLRDAQIPIVSNITAQAITSADEIRRELVEQICASVRWTQTITQFVGSGVTTVVEVGPGQVLTGLSRRASRSVRTFSVGGAADVSTYERRLKSLGPSS